MLGLYFSVPSKSMIEKQMLLTQNRMANAVEWSDGIKWQDRMAIKAESYKPPSLFPVEPTKHIRVGGSVPPAERVLSPSGRWMYTEAILPRGETLANCYGRESGDIVFDGPVVIPRINSCVDGRWAKNPWMSLTPQEILTMRVGTRFAKGTVIIGGLGMGHQLQKVCERKQVKEVIVVERDQELIDWVAPRLELNGKDVEFVCGDANELIPGMEANAALIDIYPYYGWNTFRHCPKIDKVWVWGSAQMKSDRVVWGW